MTKQKIQKEESANRKQQTKSKTIKKKGLEIQKITKNKLRQLVSARFTKETISRSKEMPEVSTENIQQKELSLENTDNLNCPICLEYCIYPVLTQCGHYYCLSCFQNAHKRSLYCCVCRSKINILDYQPSDQLQNLFQQCLNEKLDWSEIVLYQSRLEQEKNKQMKRKIPDIIHVGDMVDYNILRCWVEAKVIQIRQSYIVIQYENPVKLKSKMAKVNKKSRLLAAHRFFTRATETKKQEAMQNQVQRIQIQPREQTRSARIQQPGPIIPPVSAVQLVQRNPSHEGRDRDWEIIVMTENRTFNMWFAEELQHSFMWEHFDVNHRDENDLLLEL